MVSTSPTAAAQVPGIATSKGTAQAFVRRLVMQTTSNVIMANWSRMMWQDVVNRAVRMLALGPLGSHFISASGTVTGN
ncbi:hypothetical protein KIN20_029406 [Parelaphostrongylus tenuis]|uniref:Uncharacterized protein n=1 Tax=Parelaphostrongylus tenuis TaxID=148309 RepID=A0AAD5WFL6_PARTN|nr:hypothetical protein KIN20_029406 [Parelaphostrongylus tenuis]